MSNLPVEFTSLIRFLPLSFALKLDIMRGFPPAGFLPVSQAIS